jgi:type IV secretory pathway VirJ component
LTIHTETGTPPISDVIQILGWLDPRLTDQLSSDHNEDDLPIREVVSEFDNPSQAMAIIVTGDGGWAEIDKSIANTLATHGIPTVALDSLSYFWKRRTPNETATAVERIMTQYLAKWHKSKVILIGYSFGADVLPFIANQITAENRERVALIVLLGIGNTATFEFHLSSWMDADTSKDRLAIFPEIQKMSWANSICIYGISDNEANCTALDKLGVKVISMSGDHHFDEQYDALVQHILENMSRQK